VHVDEAGDDPLPGGVDPPGVRRKAPSPRGRHGDELAIADDEDAIGQRRPTGPVDDGAADDDQGRGGFPGRGAGHGAERKGGDGEPAADPGGTIARGDGLGRQRRGICGR